MYVPGMMYKHVKYRYNNKNNEILIDVCRYLLYLRLPGYVYIPGVQLYLCTCRMGTHTYMNVHLTSYCILT